MKNRFLVLFGLLLLAAGTAGVLCGCRKSDSAPATAAEPRPEPRLFVNMAAKAGLDFPLGHGGRSPLTILETVGSGGGFLDYDGDGWLDILLLGPDKVGLFHNDGSGHFVNVTEGSGLRQKGQWQGLAVGDYDNDGKPDLYLSGYRMCALYHNEGGGKFRDVTQEAGVQSNLWGTSACFVDVDNDGRLDLFVAHYVRYFPKSVQYCFQTGVKSACGPTVYDPEKGVLYHNKGNGRFADETAKRGLADAHGNAMGVAIADYDGDGWIDIAVANDQLPGDLFRNKGKGGFENVAGINGTAVDTNGQAHAGMGIDWADFEASGRLALVVTTYQHQPASLYTQTAPGFFSDNCFSTGVGQATLNYVGFGVKFLDYDNDGLPDLAITNGHAVDNIALTDKTTDYAQIPQLFHNSGNGRLEEVTDRAGPDFRRPVVGRALAVGDYDNDGRVDILISHIEGQPLLLHNETPNAGHWLALRLQGVRGNRDAQGARLLIEANGRKWQQTATSGGSYLSASDPRVHIGLGNATKADKITIYWPCGGQTVLRDVAGDRILPVVEPAK